MLCVGDVIALKYTYIFTHTHMHTHTTAITTTHRCYTEAGIPYDFTAVPSSSSYDSMLTKSPIIHADKVSGYIHQLYTQECTNNMRSFRLRLQY